MAIKNLSQRILTFSIVMPIVILSLQSSVGMFLLGTLIQIVSIDEYYRLTSSCLFDTLLYNRLFNTSCSLVISLGAYLYDSEIMNMNFTFIMAFYFMMGLYVNSIKNNNVSDKSFQVLAVGIFGHYYISFLWSHAHLVANTVWSSKLLLYTIITTSFGEHGGLFIGTLIPSPKVLPYLSPNKTLAGLFGSFIGCFFTSLAIGYGIFNYTSSPLLYLPFPTYLHYACLGLLIAIFGTIGDLLESYLKRSFAVKDTAALLPGWGGVLDRVDGLLLTFPITYYWVRYLC